MKPELKHYRPTGHLLFWIGCALSTAIYAGEGAPREKKKNVTLPAPTAANVVGAGEVRGIGRILRETVALIEAVGRQYPPVMREWRNIRADIKKEFGFGALDEQEWRTAGFDLSATIRGSVEMVTQRDDDGNATALIELSAFRAGLLDAARARQSISRALRLANTKVVEKTKFGITVITTEDDDEAAVAMLNNRLYLLFHKAMGKAEWSLPMVRQFIDREDTHPIYTSEVYNKVRLALPPNPDVFSFFNIKAMLTAEDGMEDLPAGLADFVGLGFAAHKSKMTIALVLDEKADLPKLLAKPGGTCRDMLARLPPAPVTFSISAHNPVAILRLLATAAVPRSEKKDVLRDMDEDLKVFGLTLAEIEPMLMKIAVGLALYPVSITKDNEVGFDVMFCLRAEQPIAMKNTLEKVLAAMNEEGTKVSSEMFGQTKIYSLESDTPSIDMAIEGNFLLVSTDSKRLRGWLTNKKAFWQPTIGGTTPIAGAFTLATLLPQSQDSTLYPEFSSWGKSAIRRMAAGMQGAFSLKAKGSSIVITGRGMAIPKRNASLLSTLIALGSVFALVDSNETRNHFSAFKRLHEYVAAQETQRKKRDGNTYLKDYRKLPTSKNKWSLKLGTILKKMVSARFNTNHTPLNGFYYLEPKTRDGVAIDWRTDFALAAIPAKPTKGEEVFTILILPGGKTWRKDTGGQPVVDMPANLEKSGWREITKKKW